MMRQRPEEAIELRAVDPEGDLACDFTIANERARSGLFEDLERGMIPPIRELDNGVEVTFRSAAWDSVKRYVELESQCCSFLDLALRRGDDDRAILTVTGRPDARDLILNIFKR